MAGLVAGVFFAGAGAARMISAAPRAAVSRRTSPTRPAPHATATAVRVARRLLLNSRAGHGTPCSISLSIPASAASASKAASRLWPSGRRSRGECAASTGRTRTPGCSRGRGSGRTGRGAAKGVFTFGSATCAFDGPWQFSQPTPPSAAAPCAAPSRTRRAGRSRSCGTGGRWGRRESPCL